MLKFQHGMRRRQGSTMTKPKHPWQCQRCAARGMQIPRAAPRARICAWCARELRKLGQRWCSAGRHGTRDWAGPKAAMCRACQRAHNQAYRAAHREELLAASRTYYQQHREALNAANRAYYQQHRAALLDQKQAYYQANAEAIKARVRQRRRLGLISEASKARERARHMAKRAIYKANARRARARRLLKLLRGAA